MEWPLGVGAQSGTEFAGGCRTFRRSRRRVRTSRPLGRRVAVRRNPDVGGREACIYRWWLWVCGGGGGGGPAGERGDDSLPWRIRRSLDHRRRETNMSTGKRLDETTTKLRSRTLHPT